MFDWFKARGDEEVCRLYANTAEPYRPDRLVWSDCVDRAAGRKLSRSDIRWIVVHHCSLSRFDKEQNPYPILDGDLGAERMILAFKNKALGTGGKTPYHVFIRISGMVEQMLSLSSQGAHARELYNPRSLAVCVAGEHAEAPQWQHEALAKVVSTLLVYIGGNVGQVAGHAELHGASKDPNKRCPHPTINMDRLRIDVAKMLPDLTEWDEQKRVEFARRAGFVFDN